MGTLVVGIVGCFVLGGIAALSDKGWLWRSRLSLPFWALLLLHQVQNFLVLADHLLQLIQALVVS